jgi:hypothetical protein
MRSTQEWLNRGTSTCVSLKSPPSVSTLAWLAWLGGYACQTSTPQSGIELYSSAALTLRLPNFIPFVIWAILVAGKVLTHNHETGKLSALIKWRNILQQIERDGFQRCQM